MNLLTVTNLTSFNINIATFCNGQLDKFHNHIQPSAVVCFDYLYAEWHDFIVLPSCKENHITACHTWLELLDRSLTASLELGYLESQIKKVRSGYSNESLFASIVCKRHHTAPRQNYLKRVV